MFGQILVCGGCFGGNGGYVEILGKQQFNMFSGSVDVGVLVGCVGYWLFDFNNFSIVVGGGNQCINVVNFFVIIDDDVKLGVNLFNV